MKTMTASGVCPICGGRGRHVIARLENTKLQKCAGCGLIYADYKDSGERGEYYKEEYNMLYGSYYKSFREKQFAAFLDDIKQVSFPGRRLLDIGCSYGLFLNKAKSVGWEAAGTEPSQKVFKIASEQHPNKIYNHGIEEIDKIPGTFDFITMWNVFEHIRTPDAAIDKIRNKLNKKGVLLLCVPNSKGFITMLSFLVYYATFGIVRSHLTRLYQSDNDYPHVFHYNRKNLEALLRKNGFAPFFFKGQDIIDVKNIEDRVGGYARSNKIIIFILSILLRATLVFSRMLRKEDEIVVMARKA